MVGSGQSLFRGALALVVGITGCASDGARPSGRAALAPATSIGERPAPERGLRLVYDVMPGDAASVDMALALAKKRLGVLLPAGAAVAVYRRDARIVVELGAMPEDDVRRARAGLIARGGLAVAAYDETDPLAPLRALSPPPGIKVRTEVVEANPGQRVETTYLWSAAAPSPEAARERLARWIAVAAPSVAHVHFGPLDELSSRERRPGVRTHVLAGEPRQLGIASARAEGSDGVFHVQVDFDPPSATFFGDLTERALRHRVAILVGSDVHSTPVVMQPIKGGSVTINVAGDDAQAVALELADRLRDGEGGVKLELAIEEAFEPARR